MLNTLTNQLQQSQPLTPQQITTAIQHLTDPDTPPQPKAALLTALAKKGETPQEIAHFAQTLRQKAQPFPITQTCNNQPILDVCGTGGDQQNTYNISTAVALLLSADNIPIAKHGNRAITSKSGSADVLQALNIPIHNNPQTAAQQLQKHNFTFLYAPQYHPTFQHIAPARKLCAQQNQPTIFNYLGPLLNPAQPLHQLIGVPKPNLTQPIAQALQKLGTRRAIIACGTLPNQQHLDELTPIGTNQLTEFYQPHAITTQQLNPQNLPTQPTKPTQLQGGTPQQNAQTIHNLLNNKDHTPKLDALLINAAAALLVADRAPNLTQAWHHAHQLIQTGAAAQQLKNLQTNQ